MPSACAVSTTVSPGAAKASGRGVSAAGVLTSGVDSNSNTSVALLRNRMTTFRVCRHCEERLVRHSSTSEGGSDEAIQNCGVPDLNSPRAMTAWPIFPSLLCRHRLGQVFRDLVEEAGGRQ